MKKLIRIIAEDKSKKSIKNKTIADKTKLSTGTISNYFNPNYKFGIPFHIFVDILNIIYQEDDEREFKSWLVDQFLENTDKLENIKEAVEWYLTTFQTNKALQLIKKHRDEHIIFQVFEQIANRSNGDFDKKDFHKNIETIRDMGSKEKDFLALIKIAEMYSRYHFRAFDMLRFLSEETLASTDDLHNEFLRESFKLRIIEAKTVSNLMKSNLKEVENECLRVVEEYKEEKYPKFIAAFYSILSERYIFEDYETALHYNEQAFRTLKNSFGDSHYNQRQLENTHDTIKIYHGDYNNLYLTGKAERAYFFAKTGESKKALKELNDLGTDETLSPFQLFYKGLALNSIELFNRAKHEFMSSGNLHYLKLVDNI